MQRGEIWWASLPATPGSEPGYSRPVLIVQANSFNVSRISTVIVVAISGNMALVNAPGNVMLSRKHTDLSKDSVANVSRLLTLDKCFLTERVSRLPASLLKRVEAGLRLVLSL